MRTFRALRQCLTVVILCSSVAACTNDAEFQDEDYIAGVDQSSVKYQAGGNCWVYAAAGWAESLHLRATNEEVDLSETYMTYWEMYERIVDSGKWKIGDIFRKDPTGLKMDANGVIQIGGNWDDAITIMRKRGMMLDADFTPQDGEDNKNTTVPAAKDIISASLTSGVLKDKKSRRNHQLVRAELDRAFGLKPEVITRLDAVFGNDGETTLKKVDAATAAAAKVITPQAFQVAVPDPLVGGQERKVRLAEVLTGELEWKLVTFSKKSSEAEQRAFFRRIQTALHDHAPVVLGWGVDRAARDVDAYKLERLTTANANKNPDGHLVLVDDYQATLKEGRVLKAGVLETRPEVLDAALRDDTRIDFLRVKNSWGPLYSTTGYFDLYANYLVGPTPAGVVPMRYIVLPAGY